MIGSAQLAKNIGVWFDNATSRSKQVNSIFTKAFYHLRNIASSLLWRQLGLLQFAPIRLATISKQESIYMAPHGKIADKTR